jgi:subunit length determinant Wzz-like protein
VTSTSRPPAEPDLDAEREVDLGRYFDALIARWWLPVLGLVVGVAIGYLLALGGKEVYRAQATVYVGTPYGPGGNVAVQGLNTNPSTVARVARGGETIRKVAAESGMSARELRAGIATRPIKSAGAAARTLPNQLYVVSVKGSRRGEVTAATAGISQRIVDVVGGYARVKIKSFREQIAADDRQLAGTESLVAEAQAAVARASGVEKLSLGTLLLTAEQRRGTLQQDRLQARQLLALAEQVELPQIIDRGAATKTTARSTRNSAAVAGLIGLVAGILAALLWEPVAARKTRAS